MGKYHTEPIRTNHKKPTNCLKHVQDNTVTINQLDLNLSLTGYEVVEAILAQF